MHKVEKVFWILVCLATLLMSGEWVFHSRFHPLGENSPVCMILLVLGVSCLVGALFSLRKWKQSAGPI